MPPTSSPHTYMVCTLSNFDISDFSSSWLARTEFEESATDRQLLSGDRAEEPLPHDRVACLRRDQPCTFRKCLLTLGSAGNHHITTAVGFLAIMNYAIMVFPACRKWKSRQQLFTACVGLLLRQHHFYIGDQHQSVVRSSIINQLICRLDSEITGNRTKT